MKTRRHRILEAVAPHKFGLTIREITAALGTGESNALQRNSSEVSVMISRRLLSRAVWAGPCTITPEGLVELERRNQDKPAAPRCGPRRRDIELTDKPMVIRTTAVDGQAPRNLVNSPFALAPGTGLVVGHAPAERRRA